MNIFTRYTLQTLKKNHTRTLVTIIGIILSVAMFTAVTESLYSGMQYLIRVTEATEGSYHGYQCNVDEKTVAEMQKSSEFTALHTLQGIGYADIGSNNQYKPYLYLAGIDDGFEDLVAVRLKEGRMPQTDSEIVLSEHLETNGRVAHKLGDTLVLQVGQRKSEGHVLDQNTGLISAEDGGETLVDTETKTYTVVGFCKRPKYVVERTEAPGYTAYVRKAPDNSEPITVFFTVHDPRAFLKASAQANTGATAFGEAGINYDWMMSNGYDTGSAFLPVVNGLGAVLMAIIMVGSVMLIYNSFSISVSERTQQFGLLRSIGATKKQMRRTVLTEGLLLSVVGIPLGLLSGCVGIGVTFRCLRPQFAAIVPQAADAPDLSIRLIPNAFALLAAAAISLLTTLISAYFPVRRAMKISAIDAIRQTGDVRERKPVKIRKKRTRSVFGFPGVMAKKYFSRSRKKYRVTIVSLALSLLLFISASSLTFYFQKSFSFEVAERPYQLTAYFDTGDLGAEKTEDAMRALSATEGVTASLFRFSPSEMMFELVAEKGQTSQTFETTQEESTKQYLSSPHITFIDDAAFRALCKEHHLHADDYFDKDHPMALLSDEIQTTYLKENGKPMPTRLHVFKEQTYPAALSFWKIDYGKYDGIDHVDFERQVVVFFTSDDTAPSDGYAEQPLRACAKPYAVTVGARLDTAPYFIADVMFPALVYPASMRDTVIAGESIDWVCYGYFQSENTEQGFDAMQKIADQYNGSIVITNSEAGKEEMLALLTLVKVFSYGFITLISLIAAANVFNTIFTNIMLRRREFAMLRSVGMSGRGIRRMMDFESLIYGFYSLLLGLPLSAAMTYVIYRIVNREYAIPFTLPWGNIAFAVASIFLVVFASMLYATDKIRKDNPIDALKNENL